MDWPSYDINRYTNLKTVALPMAIFLLSLVVVGMTYATYGLPVKPGIDFTGGTAVTLSTNDTQAAVEAYFAGFPLEPVTHDVSSRIYLLTFTNMSTARNQELIDKINGRYPDASVDYIDSSFGQTLQGQALIALLFSFIGMAIVVFLAFRTFIPSIAVVSCAFIDMVGTAAGMTLVGIPLSLPTTAALLMLIGYSVDSDILLTMRVLKRQGKLEDKLAGAFHTGIIMTSTTLAAVLSLWVVSGLGQIEIIHDMAGVLLIGLALDIMNTWITNATLLKWYAEKKVS
ncbi:MAG TPA: protein translocase subunit SecF [Methanomicrobiales archaeon]|jgi:preprotein translocase subunit SecF|nr:protein translocase subunit SecF [Methanomicrobiales archaeon]